MEEGNRYKRRRGVVPLRSHRTASPYDGRKIGGEGMNEQWSRKQG